MTQPPVVAPARFYYLLFRSHWIPTLGNQLSLKILSVMDYWVISNQPPMEAATNETKLFSLLAIFRSKRLFGKLSWTSFQWKLLILYQNKPIKYSESTIVLVYYMNVVIYKDKVYDNYYSFLTLISLFTFSLVS